MSGALALGQGSVQQILAALAYSGHDSARIPTAMGALRKNAESCRPLMTGSPACQGNLGKAGNLRVPSLPAGMPTTGWTPLSVGEHGLQVSANLCRGLVDLGDAPLVGGIGHDHDLPLDPQLLVIALAELSEFLC